MNPDASTYVLTFPMLISGILALAGTGLGIMVKKWLNDSEKAQDLKDRETHDSFVNLTNKLDKETEARHALELQLAQVVKREELENIYARIDKLQVDLTNAILQAVKR